MLIHRNVLVQPDIEYYIVDDNTVDDDEEGLAGPLELNLPPQIPEKGVYTDLDALLTVAQSSNPSESANKKLQLAAIRNVGSSTLNQLIRPELDVKGNIIHCKHRENVLKFGLNLLDSSILIKDEDNELGSILQHGKIIEISGPSGIGKSSLALSAAVTTAFYQNLNATVDENYGAVMYIDTHNSLSEIMIESYLKRLIDARLEINSNFFLSKNCKTIEEFHDNVLQSINIVRCDSFMDVVDVLLILLEDIRCESSHQVYPLIVLDDISSILLNFIYLNSDIANSCVETFFHIIKDICDIRISVNGKIAPCLIILNSAMATLLSVDRVTKKSEEETTVSNNTRMDADFINLITLSKTISNMFENERIECSLKPYDIPLIYHKNDCNSLHQFSDINPAFKYELKPNLGQSNLSSLTDIKLLISSTIDQFQSQPKIPFVVNSILKSKKGYWGFGTPGGRAIRIITQPRRINNCNDADNSFNKCSCLFCKYNIICAEVNDIGLWQ